MGQIEDMNTAGQTGMIAWPTPMVAVDDRSLPLCERRFTPEDNRVVAVFKFVAVKAPDGSWAAYYGPATWTDDHIASGGEKMPRDGARRLFPNISDHYRP